MKRDCTNCVYSYINNENSLPCNKDCQDLETWKGIDESDTVSAPTHYTSGNIECIDAIRSALTEEEFRGYCKGNVLKYTWRERMKGKDEDLKKAKQYIEYLEAK